MKYLDFRKVRVIKDVEAEIEPKNAIEKPKTRKEAVGSAVLAEICLAIAKPMTLLMIMNILSMIGSPILHKLTEEGSFMYHLPYYILKFIGAPYSFFQLGKIVEKISWRKRFQSGEFESPESIEELEKREKTTLTTVHYWSCAIWILNGLIFGLMAPSTIRNIIWPPHLVRDYPNKWIASICFN